MEHSMTIQFTRTIPVLPSLNLDKTETFYQSKLGFTTVNKFGGDYLIMQRGNCVLHFWPCDNAYLPENSSCYIHLQGVDELYAEYEAAGVIHPNGKLNEQDYGLRDFSILDGDGNLIKFGQLLAK
jgi:catechol 2,3-dioxygenase-like lactoylglutathione lyase family enzyme